LASRASAARIGSDGLTAWTVSNVSIGTEGSRCRLGPMDASLRDGATNPSWRHHISEKLQIVET